MRTAVENITPLMASAILANQNLTNRPVREAQVNVLANIIRNGQFRTTHQGIAFDTSDRLLDGQHRLLACVRAELPIKVNVTRGAPPETFTAIDVGTVRTPGDMMFIMDPTIFPGQEPLAVGIANAMTLGCKKASRKDTAEATMRKAVEFKDVINLVLPVLKGCKWGAVRRPIAAAFCNAMRTDDSVSSGFLPQEKVLAMLTRFVSLNFNNNDPMKQLYLRSVDKGRTQGGEAYGLTVSAIQACMTGKTGAYLRTSTKDFGEK